MLSLKDFKEVKIENVTKVTGGVDPWDTAAGYNTTTETRADGKKRDTVWTWTSDKTNNINFYAFNDLAYEVGDWY